MVVASFWSCPAVRLSRTWRRMNSGGSEGGEAPALTTLPQLWTERRPGAGVETGDGMETETESRPPPPPPATILFVPATAPHTHMTRHSAGVARPVSSAALRGGGIASLLVCTCGMEPSVNTASCPGTWAQRGAGRCGTVLLRHGATRGTPSPQQHSCSPPQPLVHGTWATWCSSPQPKLPSERSSHGAVLPGTSPGPGHGRAQLLQRR